MLTNRSSKRRRMLEKNNFSPRRGLLRLKPRRDGMTRRELVKERNARFLLMPPSRAIPKKIAKGHHS